MPVLTLLNTLIKFLVENNSKRLNSDINASTLHTQSGHRARFYRKDRKVEPFTGSNTGSNATSRFAPVISSVDADYSGGAL